MEIEGRSNVEIFNEVAGLAFGQLYEKFPEPTDIDLERMAYSVGLATETSPGVYEYATGVGREFEGFVVSTMQWLRSEGFVRSKHLPVYGVTLTSQALSLLNDAPEKDKPSRGAQLLSAAKSGAKTAGNTLISQLVTQIIMLGRTHIGM